VRQFATLCAVALALPGAAAACPTGPPAPGEALELRTATGHVMEIAIRDDGLQVTDLYLPEDPDIADRFVALHGIFEVEMVEVEDGEPVGIVELGIFPETLDGLPAPEPGLAWEGQSVTTYLGGDETFPRTISLSVGEPSALSYGDCAYNALPVSVETRIVYPDMTEHYTETHDFIGALGIAVLRGFGDVGASLERLDPVSIDLRAR
jgi:hypothetical protein